jgi:predicted secreted hydrolase
MDFEAKVQQALKQQMGTAVGFKVDVEKQPQFREEWRKLVAKLDQQYERVLAELKQELTAIP